MATQAQGASAPAVFNFHDHHVRVIDRDGQPWFVAADVCAALRYKNPSQTVADHLDADERAIAMIGRQGDTNIINESGLYALVLRSRKPEARRFAKWVTSEVLPAIRQTGRYAPAESAPVRNQRWLLTFGPDGRQYMAAIPPSAYILEPHQIAGVIRSPEFDKQHLQKVMEAITHRTGFVFSTYRSLHDVVGVVMAIHGLIDALVVPAVHKLEEETGQALYNRSEEDRAA